MDRLSPGSTAITILSTAVVLLVLQNETVSLNFSPAATESLPQEYLVTMIFGVAALLLVGSFALLTAAGISSFSSAAPSAVPSAAAYVYLSETPSVSGVVSIEPAALSATVTEAEPLAPTVPTALEVLLSSSISPSPGSNTATTPLAAAAEALVIFTLTLKLSPALTGCSISPRLICSSGTGSGFGSAVGSTYSTHSSTVTFSGSTGRSQSR